MKTSSNQIKDEHLKNILEQIHWYWNNVPKEYQLSFLFTVNTSQKTKYVPYPDKTLIIMSDRVYNRINNYCYSMDYAKYHDNCFKMLDCISIYEIEDVHFRYKVFWAVYYHEKTRPYRIDNDIVRVKNHLKDIFEIVDTGDGYMVEHQHSLSVRNDDVSMGSIREALDYIQTMIERK